MADANLSDEEKARQVQALHDEWQSLHDQVIAAGGLHIIGTERHESRRIDNQLRGRGGRQGDPGSSRFYLSMDDSLLRIFAGERLKAMMDRLKILVAKRLNRAWCRARLNRRNARLKGITSICANNCSNTMTWQTTNAA